MTIKITTEQFDTILAELMDERSASDLLMIPGIYEIVSEHFNNEVLDRFRTMQEMQEEDDQ